MPTPTTTEKKSATSTRKIKKASTPPAKLEARSGNNGRLWFTFSSPSRRKMGRGVSVAPKMTDGVDAERQQNQNSKKANYIQDRHAVAAGRRVVFTAEQQQMIYGAADAPLGRFHKAQFDVARWKFDPVEAARDLSLRRQHENSRRMRVETRLRI